MDRSTVCQPGAKSTPKHLTTLRGQLMQYYYRVRTTDSSVRTAAGCVVHSIFNEYFAATSKYLYVCLQVKLISRCLYLVNAYDYFRRNCRMSEAVQAPF